MRQTDPRNAETVHVFAVDASLEEARDLAADGARLSDGLGGIEVEPDRAETVDPRALGDYGLSGYLIEGEGVSADSIVSDEPMLDAVREPVLILRPRAITVTPAARPPLRLLGSYPLEHAKPAGEPLRAASAEGSAAGVPPEPDERPRSNRRASGLVAMAALAVALLVAFVMWAIAA